MRAVPEFGHALLKELGAPKATVIETFAEVRFKDAAGKAVIPDGAIVCRRGAKTWTCLVEVKTAVASLRDEQVSAYLDVAKDNGFDGVLTISNQITASSAESPVSVDGRKLKRTCLWHFSWWRVLTEAIVQHRYRGISDPDQAWILGKLIAYLDSAASGAGGFEDMGDKWVGVRKAAHDGTLRQNNPEARAVAERWEEFTQYLCLGLSQDLGRAVSAVLSLRKQTVSARLDESVKQLADDDVVSRPCSAYRTLLVTSASRRTCVRVGRSRASRSRLRARVVPSRASTGYSGSSSTRRTISGSRPRSRTPARPRACCWETCARSREKLFYAADPKREPRSFTITLARAMGQKRGKAEGSFVREIRSADLRYVRRDRPESQGLAAASAESARVRAGRRLGYAIVRATAIEMPISEK